MPAFALMQGSTIHALSEDEAAWPADVFDVRNVSHLPDAAIGGRFDEDGAYHPPEAPEVDLAGFAAACRFALETGGIAMPDGTRIATDRESQGLIERAVRIAESDPDESIDFKAASGWIELDAETVLAVGRAVGRHVRQAFRIERQVAREIADGTLTTPAAVAAAFA